jgi:hypothetical protein
LPRIGRRPDVVTQSRVRVGDLGSEGVGDLVGEEGADLFGGVVVFSPMLGWRRQLGDLSAQVVVGDIVPIGIGDDHEARRYGEAGAGQLAEVRTLPPA